MGRFRLSDDDSARSRRTAMRSLMGSFLTISLLVYLGFGAFLYANQRAMIYLPMPENRSTDVLHERITVNGVSIKIWVVNPGRERGALYFGGNAEDVYFNADEFRHFLPDVTTYLVNYRGYGGSEGKPTERVLFADALALFDYLAPRHTGLDAIGRSLGSGVATYLASQRPVGRLALVTPFDDIAAVAGRMYPVYPTQLLLKDRYHSAAYAPHVVAAVQLVIAEHDTLIPAEHAHRLADAFAHDDVVKVTIPGAGHNGISRSGAYWDALAGFFLGEAAFAADRVVD